jgi:hypothetical protein
MTPRTSLLLAALCSLAAACGGTPAATTTPTSGAGSGDGWVDCARIDDEAYRAELRGQGIEPDSIECGEEEDRGATGDVDCARIDDPDYRGELIEDGIDPDSIECGEEEGAALDDLDE